MLKQHYELINSCVFYVFQVISAFEILVLKSSHLGLVQWLSTKGKFDPQETLSNTWRHWVEVKIAAEQHTMHRKAPTTRGYLAQNTNTVEIKKLWASEGPFKLPPVTLRITPGVVVSFLAFWFKIMSPSLLLET